MQYIKKVLTTFIFTLFLLFLGTRTINAYQATITDIVTVEKETTTSGGKTIAPGSYFTGTLSDLIAGKYRMKISVKEPQGDGFEYSYGNITIPANISTAKFNFYLPVSGIAKDSQYISTAELIKEDDGATEIQKKETCYAGYRFTFTCPENDIIGTTQTTLKRQGLDVVFVMDRSETVANIVANMKLATLGIVGKLDSSIDRVGLVSFGDWGTRLVDLTNNFSLTTNAIKKWSAGAQTTNIADGIKKATDMFSAFSSNRKKIMIVVSDGVANSSTSGECPDSQSYPVTSNKCTQDALNQSGSAKSKGISVYTIGYNFAKTNKIKANAGNFAKSLMTFISSNYNFTESDELKTLFAVFDNIVKRNTVYVKSTLSGCADVSVKFNYNVTNGVSYAFQPKSSGAYKGYDAKGISWLFGDVGKTSEGSDFVTAVTFQNPDYSTFNFDSFAKDSNQGFGEFVVSYKVRKTGITKNLTYSHSDILEHTIKGYQISPVFDATYEPKGCKDAPVRDPDVIIENPNIEDDTDTPKTPDITTTETQAKLTINRTITAIDCNTVRVKLNIKCLGTVGKCNKATMSLYNNYSNFDINSLVSDAPSSAIQCEAVNSKIECVISKDTMSAGQEYNIEYKLSLARSIDSKGKDIPLQNPVEFYSGNSNYFTYFNSDLLYDGIKILGDNSTNVKECVDKNNQNFSIDRVISSTNNCQEANVKVVVKCKNTDGCKGNFIIFDKIAKGNILVDKNPTITIKDSINPNIVRSIKNNIKNNLIQISLQRDIPLSYFDYLDTIELDYLVKLDEGGNQIINSEDAYVEFIDRDNVSTKLNIDKKSININDCDNDIPDTPKTDSQYYVKRTVYPDTCQKAKIKLEIICLNENGCSAFDIKDYLPIGTKYVSDPREKMDLCVVPSSPIASYINSYMGGTVICNVAKNSVKKGETRINEYYILFDNSHLGEQITNRSDLVAYNDSELKPVYFNEGKIKVSACQSNIVIKSGIETLSECGTIKVTVSATCKTDDQRGCKEILRLNHVLEKTWKVKDIYTIGCAKGTNAVNCVDSDGLGQNETVYFSYSLSILPEGEYDIFKDAKIFVGNSPNYKMLKLNTVNFVSQDCSKGADFEFICKTSASEQQEGEQPNDIVLVLDVSGSMTPSINKLRDAVVVLAKVVGANDRIGIVTFSGYNQSMINRPLSKITESDKTNISNNITIKGSTNMYRGVELGLQLLKTTRPNAKKTMIIFSDGGPNEGKDGLQIDLLRSAYPQIKELLDNNKLYDNISIVYLGFLESEEGDSNVSMIARAIKEGMLSLKRGNNSIYLHYNTDAQLHDSFAKVFNSINNIDDKSGNNSCRNIKISANIPDGINIKEIRNLSPTDSKNPVWKLNDMINGESVKISIIFESTNGAKTLLQKAIQSFKYSYSDSLKEYSGSFK